jgi:uncharacterized protein YijF (DUF1287 family)
MTRPGLPAPPPAAWALPIAMLVLAVAAVPRPMQTVGERRAQPAPGEDSFLRRFVASAVERTRHSVRYDPAYVPMPYPGGDVPGSTGVCTDEVIRAYRGVGIDLQKEVHEDLLRHPDAYPRKWSAGSHQTPTDTNIDHRRVPNLMVFFGRRGEALPVTRSAEDYRPGDLVAWNLGGETTHMGIVVDEKSPETGRRLIVHNIGTGPQMEDVLFRWRIIGHYRYQGASEP